MTVLLRVLSLPFPVSSPTWRPVPVPRRTCPGAGAWCTRLALCELSLRLRRCSASARRRAALAGRVGRAASPGRPVAPPGAARKGFRSDSRAHAKLQRPDLGPVAFVTQQRGAARLRPALVGRVTGMPSVALSSWQTKRAARLDQLKDAHTLLSGSAGANVSLEAIDWSRILVLAAEFQGFARELHDEASEFLASAVARGDQKYFEIVRNNLTISRSLDAVNAKPASVAADFQRLGISDLWEDIEKSSPDGARWHSQLGILNKARNAVAHGNPAMLNSLSGIMVNTVTIVSWRSACDGVCELMDGILMNYLKDTTGRVPW